jgi:hypothetical protein
MKNISGNAGNWVESEDPTKLYERNTETINVQDELNDLLKIQARLFTKHLKSNNKNIGDSLIVLDSAIKSLELN